MGVGTRFEKMESKTASATATGVTITWTSNEPTAATTQTIANGTIPTVAELGQYVANNEAQIALIVADIAKLIADMETVRSKINAGEGG